MSAPRGALQLRRMASNSVAQIGHELAGVLTDIERTEMHLERLRSRENSLRLELRSHLRGELQAGQPEN